MVPLVVKTTKTLMTRSSLLRVSCISFALLIAACTPPDTVEPAALSKAAASTANGATTRTTPKFAEDMASLGDSLPYGAFVHFSSGTPEQHRSLVAERGLRIGHDFEENAQALYVIGQVSAFKSLMGHPMVGYLEDNFAMPLLDDTDVWATRVRMAQEPVSGGPYFDAAGNILRGQGVGVGVIDSGLRGDHPDFADNLARNYRVSCPVAMQAESSFATCQFADIGKTTSSEVAGGHGTHCAGIAVGSGSASTGLYPVADAAPNVKGSYAGVAPGAKLYAFGCGAGLNILLLEASASFNKAITDNKSGLNNPKIRVLSNSYGGDAAFNPDALLSKLTNRAIDEGISVVFAAGNDGEAEAATAADPSKTGASCRNPKPGLICVASYNDEGSGRRDAALSGFSSRAEVSKLSEYPDIAAPGDLITSPCSQGDPGQVVCSTGAETRWAPLYGTISGTSMATPHVAGIIALMYQVKPDLTPAQVEDLIKDNALKLTSNGPYVDDPSNPGGTTNRGFGAGLIDLPTLLDKLGATKAGLPPAGTKLIADGDSETMLAGAADIVRLTMTEKNEGGQNGIAFALTLRDAAAFGTPAATQVRFSVGMNVDGKKFSAGAVLKPDGSVAVVSTGPNANAAASSAAKTGNVVEFFVPLGALGGPAIGAPIHNIMASSFTTGSTGETAVDYTPSSTATASLAAVQPVFGKPYTVLTASTPVSENICTPPGATVLTDSAGDILVATGQSSLQSYDISSLGIAQPFYANGAYKIVFTLKMASLNPLPQGTTWPINFCAPAVAECTGASAYSATNKYFTVRMTTDPAIKINAAGSAPEFQVLTATPGSATAASRVVKLADAESKFNADGTITIVANAADIGLTAADAGKPAQSLSMFLVRISNSSGTTPDNMPNAATQGAGLYATRPVAFCAPNQLPVPKLTVDAPSKRRGTEFTFNGETSSDPDAGDTIASYEFNFGDQTTPVVSASATAKHAYAVSGSYSVSLKVTDSKGAVSTVPATLGVAVSNSVPLAALNADKTGGGAPLTIAFDASTSSDPDLNDRVASYSYDLDGDGTFEITGSLNAKPSFTYNTAGSYTAKVKVKDSEGLESAVASTVITVTDSTTSANTAPTARLTADKTTGAAPLTVVFDASTSSDTDVGDAVQSYSFDLDGDGRYEITDSGNAKPGFTYSAAGSYTARVMVKDRAGLQSAAATVQITVSGAASPPASSNRPPVAVLRAPGGSVPAQSAATFDGVASYDPDGNDGVQSLSFDFGDGSPVLTVTAGAVQHRYAAQGRYTVSLVVTDTRGAKSAPVSQTMSIGPAAPVTAPAPITDTASTPASSSGGAASPALLALLALMALPRRRRAH